MLRDLVFNNRISDAAIATFFSRLGCNQCLLVEFSRLVHDLSAMDYANVPVPLQKLVASLAGKSYFTMRRSIKFVDYTNGTGAGNPLADVLFNFLIARILRHIDLMLEGHDLQYCPKANHSINFFGIDLSTSESLTSASYFDDGIFFIEHPDAHGCLENPKL